MAADDGSVVLRIKRKRTEDPLDALREFLDFLNMYERSFCLILYPAQGLKKFLTHASFLNVFLPGVLDSCRSSFQETPHCKERRL